MIPALPQALLSFGVGRLPNHRLHLAFWALRDSVLAACRNTGAHALAFFRARASPAQSGPAHADLSAELARHNSRKTSTLQTHGQCQDDRRSDIRAECRHQMRSKIKKIALASCTCRPATIKEWHSAHAVSARSENVRNKIGRASNQRRCRALAGHHNDYAGIAIKIAEQFNGRRSVSVEHAVKIQRQDSVNGRHSPRPHCPSNLGSKLRFVFYCLREQCVRLSRLWLRMRLRLLWPSFLHGTSLRQWRRA